METKAVIFDMDGVIFDSERAVYNCWLELAAKYNITDIETIYMRCIGVNSVMTRQIFIDYYGEDFPFDEYNAEFSKNYHERYDNGRLPMKPGIRELLISLKENKYKIAIASSTRSRVVEQQIKDAGLREYFDVIIGGDMIERSKPEPDIFLKAAEMLDVLPEKVYVIEDSFNGIRAAFAGGMIPIMVPDMIEPDNEMKEKARYIFKDLYGVKELLLYMKRVEDLVPKNKFDFSGIDELKLLSDEEIIPILPALLGWMKDMNWPIAKEMPMLLSKHQKVIIPFIIEALRPEQLECDWKYYIIVFLLPLLDEEYLLMLKPSLERIAESPTWGEKDWGTDIEAKELLDKMNGL